MPTPIARYQSGEHEQVWADLVSLGPRVREKQYFPDAQAVAQETMRRARHNVETLIVRLEKLGYEFLTAQRDARESLHGLNRAMGFLRAVDKLTAGSNSNPVLEKMRQRNQAMPNNPLFKGMLAWLQQSAAKPAPADPLENPDVYSPPTNRAPNDLARCENSIGGPLPLSLHAWCEIVGSVSLMGSHPVLCFREGGEGTPLTMYMNPDLFQFGSGRAQLEQMRAAGVNIVTEIPAGKETPLADPLVVSGDTRAWEYEHGEGDAIHLISLAPDDLHKANISGDAYYMELPDQSADAPFQDWHHTNFVNYLRIAFRWGGFPGWERYPNRPDKELAYLAEGLLPI